MTDEQITGIVTYLNGERNLGHPCVAFDDRPDRYMDQSCLHVFSSAIEAEEFCDQANNQVEYAEQGVKVSQYIFTPVKSLLSKLNRAGDVTATLMPTAIAGQMAAQGLHLLSGKSFEDLLDAFQRGLVYPVIWKKTVDPIEAIADSHVVSQRHCGGVVYELGHSIQLMETFEKFSQAKDFINNATFYSELSDKEIDHALVGRFHGYSLQLDRECYTQAHSGITLLTAHYTTDHSHEWQEVQSLFKPATISLYFLPVSTRRKSGFTMISWSRQPRSRLRIRFPFHFTNEYLTSKNWNIMLNQKNHDYLKNQLLYTGFGDGLNEPLKAKMLAGADEFTLSHSKKFAQDEVNSTLHFSKSDKTDLYFFNKFDLSLKQAGKDDVLTQTYLIGEKHNYTLQERYNMLEGRAVYKEQPKMEQVMVEGKERMKPTGETYMAWKDLNFKETDTHGNFLPKTMFWNHEKELANYPIKAMSEPYDRNRLLASLEKGNLVKVSIQKDGREIEGLVAANPRQQRIDFYTADGQRMAVAKVMKETQAQKQALNDMAADSQKPATAQTALSEHDDRHKKQTRKQDVAAEAGQHNQGKKRGVSVS